MSDVYNILYGNEQQQQRVIQEQTGEKSMIVTSDRSIWQILGSNYNSPDASYILPNGETVRGNEIENWGAIPSQTEIRLEGIPRRGVTFREVGEDDTLWSLVGNQYDSQNSIYFLPDGRVRTGQELPQSFLNNPDTGTKILTDYVNGGTVQPRRPVGRITRGFGERDVLYRLPSSNGEHVFKRGDEIDERNIPIGTYVFFPSYNE